MRLKVIGTGSKGNCYLLIGRTETLILECGVKVSEIKRGLNYDLENVVGCLVTHEHGDHSKSIHKLKFDGIDIYASVGTHESLDTWATGDHHRIKALKHFQVQQIGSFKVLPFAVKHDAKEPLGFLINHFECGNVLFLTDTQMLNYRFQNLNQVIIEANYSEKIFTDRAWSGKMPSFLQERIIDNHLSLQQCQKLLKMQDISKVHNIVLIHLSDTNSDSKLFYKTIQQHTGKKVTVAEPGLKLPFDLIPF